MFIREPGAVRYRFSVVVAFALTLSLIIASGVLAWLNARAQDRTSAVVIRAHGVLGLLNQIENTMTDAETGQRGYLLATARSLPWPTAPSATCCAGSTPWSRTSSRN